ncbi:chromatin modification- protein VID21 [Tulasnella sp. 424]|nr:chromatin modification- protein VID21 [Tulasnella sp. 424]
MRTQHDPTLILSLESELDETSSENGVKFLSEWDIGEDFAFKSISLLSTDVPQPPSPRPSSGSRGSFESPSRPPKPSSNKKENEMEVDSPERKVAQPTEEALVDAMVKDEDEDEEETSLAGGEAGEEEVDEEPNQPEKMDSEPMVQDPATPPSIDEPRTPPPVKIADMPSNKDEDRLGESSAAGSMDWDNSPPRRTLGDAPQTSPHYRHNSPVPPRPQSPTFDDLTVNPKDVVLSSPPLLEPLVTEYSLSLYPLPPVPPTPKKNKKEKKEKNKSLELYRWQASIASTPVAALLRKATKCLSSKEWAVGFSERRFYKAMRQVEVLKSEGRWSFRQPKKSKGPILQKVHWDYVLDEMRWLQADFREERKWKTAVAFEIAHEVAAWHRASPEERRAMCVQWRPPVIEDVPEAEDTARTAQQEPLDLEARDDEPEDTTSGQREAPLEDAEMSSVPMDEQDEPKDDSGELGAGADPETSNAAETLKQLDAQPAPSEEPHIKEEAMAVDFSAFRAGGSEDAEGEGEQDGDGEDGDGEAEDIKDSIMGMIQDPFDTAPDNEAANGDKPSGSSGGSGNKAGATIKVQHAQSLRAPLLQDLGTTDTILDLAKLTDNLSLDPPAPSSNDSGPSGLREQPAIKLPDLFPELTAYGPFVSAAELKGKLDKRIDETNNGKLTYVSRLFDIKPILISTLQPAKKRKLEGWDDLAEFYPADDTVQELRPAEFYLPPPPPLFSGNRKPKEYPQTRLAQTQLTQEQAQHRVTTQVWTPEEDAQLKHFAFLYSLNWQLVADAFATWRKSISTDRRTDWDCMVRWDRMFGPMSKQLALQQQQQQQQQMELDDNTPIGSRKGSRNIASRYKDPPPPTPSSAGGSVQMMPPPGQQQPNPGPLKLSDLNRKQIRRGFMHEAMKRTAKKRELALQKATNNQVKSRNIVNIHETHVAQPGLSPAELSLLKLDRDRKEAQAVNIRKEQAIRQMLAATQQRMGTPGIGSKLPVSAMMAAGGPNQVAQIRNMQAAQVAQMQRAQAQAQAVAAQQQQQQQQQAQASQQQSPPAVAAATPTPPMSRVPTVTQQAVLAQAGNQGNPSAAAAAQLAVAQQVAASMQAQQGQGQGSPPRPTPQQAASLQQQQQLLRAQQLGSQMQPFDPSMMSGMTPEQMQLAMTQQMHLRMMMQQAQQNQINNLRAAANGTPVQPPGNSGAGASPPGQG